MTESLTTAAASDRAQEHYPWWPIFLPDRGAWFFVYVIFGMLFIRPELLLWDGGSCRHIINGVMICTTGKIPDTNYASAIFPNSECLTRSWLSDAISGVFYQMSGLTGVVFICATVIVLGLTWSYQMGRARGLGLLSGLVALALVMATAGMHWSARSHVYSYLPFLALYYVLFMFEGSAWKRTVLVALSMVAWVNLHGSFGIGMAMIGFKLLFDFIHLIRQKDKNAAKAQFGWDAAALIAGLLATGINPRGFSFYTHVAGYLSNPTILHKTDEWRAFDLFAGIGSPAFLILLGILTYLIVKTQKVPSGAEIALFILLALAGFESMRLIPYCALLVMPVAGPAWAELKQRYAVDEGTTDDAVVEPSSAGETSAVARSDTGRDTASRRERTHVNLNLVGPEVAKPSMIQRICKLEYKAEPNEIHGLKVASASIVLVALLGVVTMSVPYFRVKDFDPERLPVQAIDYMQAHPMPGLGFNYDNWGGYLYFKLHKRVFIDDWADFLPLDFIDAYMRILTGKTAWQNDFDKYNFQWVLTPNEAQIAQILSQSPKWKTAYRDKTAILLVKQSSAEAPKQDPPFLTIPIKGD